VTRITIRSTGRLFALAGVLLVNWSLATAGGEEPVRKAFMDFQAALKERDAAKIWELLDTDSQKAAERAARAIKGAYAGAGADKKAKMEKSLGLPGSDLAALTGQGFLKTTGFHGKYHEVPGSKIMQVMVQGDRATVTYIEEDGDKEKLRFNRQGGKWKVSAPMPPVAQP
jgi:hypothetical protein